MIFARAIPAFLLLCVSCSICYSQRPGPEFWRKLTCEPVEPRTKLEALEDRQSSIVIRGFTRITTLEIRGVRIDAVEMREMGNVGRAKGAVIVLQREREGRVEDNRAFIDYEELDPLLNAIDHLSRVDETVTKLAGFEAHYRTLGDFEVRVFRQTRSGAAVMLQTGICDFTTQALTLDDLAKLKAMLLEVKTRVDELK
jgi:hypothetical protein